MLTESNEEERVSDTNAGRETENSPAPLLVISDAISGQSGLARITRDLAVRVHNHLPDVYRIGVAGCGGSGSRNFGFPQYHLGGIDNWVLPALPEIVEDFAGRERCRIMFIWDLHRVSWFSQPERLGQESLAKHPALKQWLLTANIEKWCYVPLDSSGPNDKLSYPIALTALGFDRLLAYGRFGEDLLRRTIGNEQADTRHLTNLPHGIDSSVFYEHDRKTSRAFFLQHTGAQSTLHMLGVQKGTERIQDDEVLLGCVCTNQQRKDLALLCETIAILAKTHRVRFWLHTDELERAWSIPSLLVDHGILERTIISLGYLPDEKLAAAYSACDVTIGPGSEGFGFPLLESQFCGTPVVTMSYAGGADIVPEEWQVDPVAFRYEGSYSSKRPVFNAKDWANKADYLIGKRCNRPGKYDWDRLWPERWEPWFREAVK